MAEAFWSALSSDSRMAAHSRLDTRWSPPERSFVAGGTAGLREFFACRPSQHSSAVHLFGADTNSTGHRLLDVSDECLLRRWDLAKEWLKAEDRDRDELRELCRAAEYAEWPKRTKPLEGLTLDRFRAWRTASSADASCAQRYEMDFSAAESYLN